MGSRIGRGATGYGTGYGFGRDGGSAPVSSPCIFTWICDRYINWLWVHFNGFTVAQLVLFPPMLPPLLPLPPTAYASDAGTEPTR